MTHRARQTAVVGLVLAVAACGPAEPESSPSATASPIVATTTRPTAPQEAPMTLDEPPAASLSAAGAEGIAGDLGSYIIGDEGSDSPWLPGEPVTVPAGAQMSVTLGQRVPIGGWRGRISEASDTGGLNVRAYGSGAGDPVLPAPPAGAWTLAVTLEFAGFDGEATYYWRLSIEEP